MTEKEAQNKILNIMEQLDNLKFNDVADILASVLFNIAIISPSTQSHTLKFLDLVKTHIEKDVTHA